MRFATKASLKVMPIVALSFGVFCFMGEVGSLPAFGQASGSIVGTVADASGARAPGVAVTATNRELGIVRSVLTNQTGAYTISALQPGNYEVSAELAGFSRAVQRATVNVGRDVTVDFRLEVGEVTQTVEVAAEATAINMVDSKVDAIISQKQIQDLPLIGRNAYEMAKLVPGVQVSSVGSRNREFNISIAGAATIATRFTIDGLVYNDMTVGGGVINLSQEMVQEFQVSVNNGDASMGMAQSGAINLVTRSGGNQLHGSAFGFFRDNEYAAFPGLRRPIPTPNTTNDPQIASFNESAANPDFYRRQYGGLVGGPIKRDRLFWLASVEHTPQLSVQPFDANLVELQTFNSLIDLPRRRLVQNYRVDWRANDNHSLFWRYTWDRVRIAQFRAMPSTTSPTLDRTYAAAMGWTQVWSPSLVNDVRLGFSRYHRNEFASEDLVQEEAKRYAPALPWTSWTTVSGTQLIFGLWQSGRTNEMFPRAEIVDNLTHIRGKHTWKMGLNIDRVTNMFKWPTDDTYTASLFNPTQARQAGISVPSSFTTVGDLMQLPLNTIAFGIGDPQFPDAYFHADRYSYNFHFYGGSTYRATPNLTLNWTLSYSYANNEFNHDLPKPQSLSRVFSGRLYPNPKDKNNLFPKVGFAWDPRGQGRSVIRGGFGIYTGGFNQKTNYINERQMLVPLGRARVSVPGDFITNPLNNQTKLVFPTAGSNAAAGVVRFADLAPFIPAIRAQYERTVFTGTNNDLSVTNFDFFKGTASRNLLHDPDAGLPYSLQSMLGFQQQLGTDWLVSASGVYNVTNHVLFQYDANRQFRVASRGGRVDPALNAVTVRESGGKAVYKGLLINATKRMSNRYQIGLAYTYSSSKSQANPVTLDNFRAAYGPDVADLTHVLNINAVVELPLGMQVSLVNQMQSRPTFNVFLSQIDLDGDGTTNDGLPGVGFGEVNRGVSKEDLRRSVAEFNQTYAGARDARGTLIRPITLPERFDTGDRLISQDIRLSKKIAFGENVSAQLIGEVFNIFNIANLVYSATYNASAGNLYSTGFGQPSSRFDSLFGSGGPRSFQFGVRVSF